MAIDQLAISGISLTSGAVMAAQDLPGIESLVEKAGLGVITVMIVYWMLNNFSRRLDRLAEAIERLAEGERKE